MRRQRRLDLSPRSRFSRCSLLLRLSTNSPMKTTTMPTSTHEMVTIIFMPSPPPELSLPTVGAFTNGAIVPECKYHTSQYLNQNMAPLKGGKRWLALRKRACDFKLSSFITFTAMSSFTPAASLEALFLIYCAVAAL